jgi:hypothetical protein
VWKDMGEIATTVLTTTAFQPTRHLYLPLVTKH